VDNLKIYLAITSPSDCLLDNIEMDVREIGWDDMDCIDLALDWDQWRALVNKVINLRVP
jgi:hypothetical protein